MSTLEKKPEPLKEAIKAPAKIVTEAVADTSQLLQSSGYMSSGLGLRTGAVAFMLGLLSLLGVVAFHFPQYLTTPELRQIYSADALRYVLFASLITAASLSIINIILGRHRGLNCAALLLVIAAQVAGGANVQVPDFPNNTPYIGMDWFILDLLGSTLIFIAIEKMFPLYRGQPVFRPEWQTDLVHFMFNHFIVGLVLLTVNFLIHRIFGWMVHDGVQNFVQSIHFLPQLLLCILVADLVQYWTHRSYHEIPFLWRFHSVHHSVLSMDWLAGSRQHVCELICTRVGVLGALYVLGFEKEVMDWYIIIVGFQAVFNHANVHLPWGPLKYVFVTPDFHHWHHASDDVAIDKNYAAHYAFLDYLFGTAVKGQTGFPKGYGVVGNYMPEGFVRQQMFPFMRKKKKQA